MRFWTRRDGNKLLVYDDASAVHFEKLPWNKPLRTEVRQPRNVEFHRLFFALCNRIAEGVGQDVDFVVKAFKLKTGHYTVYKTIGGRDAIDWGSIGFDAMDEVSFREFFNKCVVVMYQDFGIDPAAVADLLIPEGTEPRR